MLAGETVAAAFEKANDKQPFIDFITNGDSLGLSLHCSKLLSDDLSHMSRKQLSRMADKLDIKCFTRLTKDELVVAIKEKKNVPQSRGTTQGDNGTDVGI